MTTAEDRLASIELGRQDLAEMAPLPSAESLAAPFVQGINALFEAFEGRATAMEFDLEQAVDGHLKDGQPNYVEQATELVATAERVASIIRTAIHNHLAGEFHSELVNIDDVIRSITQSPYIETCLNRAAIDRIIYGD